MTYSIIVKAKLFYLWTTYLCSIFSPASSASIRRFLLKALTALSSVRFMRYDIKHTFLFFLLFIYDDIDGTSVKVSKL